MEQQYSDQFLTGHKPTCLWRTGGCPPNIQYLTSLNGSEQPRRMAERLERLYKTDLNKLVVPEGHNYGAAETLAILGWDIADGHSLNCIFGCSTNIELDETFDPFCEHRWCCPVVLTDPTHPESSGWKFMLSVYQKIKK